MKNLIIKLSLIAVLVVACNTAMAVFTDGPGVQALMHCDATNQAVWLTTPDDNSSGRAANECILDMWIDFTTKNTDTEPVMMPGSPKGGSYFEFDGALDSICLNNPGWLGGDSLLFECSFKANGFAPAGQYDVLAGCRDTWVCFLANQDGTPHIALMLQQSVIFHSPVEIIAGEWNDISVSVVDLEVKITVNGSTYTEATPLWPTFPSLLAVGYDLRTGTDYFDGDMDEILIGNIPEPFTFGLIGIFGLLALRLRK